MLRLKIQIKDSDKFFKLLLSAVEKTVWIFNQTTMHATSGLIIHIMIWLGVGQDAFCGSVCRFVRTLAALYCARILSSERGAFCRGTIPFQSINIPYLSGDGGLLSILSQSRCRFTSPVITLNSWLNWPMVPSYGSARHA